MKKTIRKNSNWLGEKPISVRQEINEYVKSSIIILIISIFVSLSLFSYISAPVHAENGVEQIEDGYRNQPYEQAFHYARAYHGDTTATRNMWMVYSGANRNGDSAVVEIRSNIDYESQATIDNSDVTGAGARPVDGSSSTHTWQCGWPLVTYIDETTDCRNGYSYQTTHSDTSCSWDYDHPGSQWSWYDGNDWGPNFFGHSASWDPASENMEPECDVWIYSHTVMRDFHLLPWPHYTYDYDDQEDPWTFIMPATLLS